MSAWSRGTCVGVDDEKNKAILIGDRVTFAYTGMAEVEQIRDLPSISDMAEHFAHQMCEELLATGSTEAALHRVGQGLESRFAAIPANYRRHAFVGVGWTEDRLPVRRTPFILCESNYLDAEGNRAPIADARFLFSRVTLAGEPFRLHIAGVPLASDNEQHRQEELRLHAQVGYAVSQSDEPLAVAEILVQEIRRVAAAPYASGAVGQGVMINCLPQITGPPGRQRIILDGAPRLGVTTFTFLSASVPSDPAQAVIHGPYAVSGGMVMSGFTVQGIDGPPPQGQSGFLTGPVEGETRMGKVGQRIKLPTLRRNDPCWCGSGRKFKKCHGP